MDTSSPTYTSLVNLLRAYRLAGGANDTISSGFNTFDTPATLCFRLFFDFNNGLLDTGEQSKIQISENEDGEYQAMQPEFKYRNSAINYLKINNEWERADMLTNFVGLLSNINTYSPWYFQTIAGLDEALTRPEFTGDAFTLPEQRKISIKCLPDAYDGRIGTLLDLYKAAAYSYRLNKEILPANLRWFNMYIYIFSVDLMGIHSHHSGSYKFYNNTGDGEFISDATYDQSGIVRDPSDGSLRVSNGGLYITSSKLIELRDCEIDMGSNKYGYGELNNSTGFQQEYTIDIKFKRLYEQRYNELLHRIIGDYVISDTFQYNDILYNSTDVNKKLEVPSERNIASSGGRVIVEGSIEKHQPSGPSMLGSKMYQDGSSLLDPWKKIANDRLGDIEGQVRSITNATKATVESWADVSKLNRNLADTVRKLTYGNLFYGVNFQSNQNKISDKIYEYSSKSVLGKVTKQGWTKVERSNPSSMLGKDIADV